MKRTAAHRFKVLPNRWIVERTFAWLNHFRRSSKDYELRPYTAESMVKITMVHLLVRRLARI
ncbi:transposase [Acidithiobacillus sp.]